MTMMTDGIEGHEGSIGARHVPCARSGVGQHISQKTDYSAAASCRKMRKIAG